MTQAEAVVLAIDYLYFSEKRVSPIDNFRLNKQLHSKLCKAFDRLSTIQIVDPMQIYMLIESWIIAQDKHLDALVALKSPF